MIDTLQNNIFKVLLINTMHVAGGRCMSAIWGFFSMQELEN